LKLLAVSAPIAPTDLLTSVSAPTPVFDLVSQGKVVPAAIAIGLLKTAMDTHAAGTVMMIVMMIVVAMALVVMMVVVLKLVMMMVIVEVEMDVMTEMTVVAVTASYNT
jgi:hypothetical protein